MVERRAARSGDEGALDAVRGPRGAVGEHAGARRLGGTFKEHGAAERREEQPHRGRHRGRGAVASASAATVAKAAAPVA
eukprot:scaffold118455_cov33-Phaeocystis_antarctica.AAC.1